MLTMNLTEHYISTYRDIISKKIKLKLYSSEKIKWQKKNRFILIKVKIIMSCKLSWTAFIKFISKKEKTDLWIIHFFISINDVTIKSNYSMCRMKFILNNIKLNYIEILFQADTVNSY